MAVRSTITVPRLIVPLALLTVLSGVLFSGIRAPGKYCGVVVYDRWDGCTLCSGTHVMYISENTKDGLRPYAGKCIQIYARKVTQPMNPGDGLISDLDYLGPAPPANSGLSLQGIDLRTAPAFADGEPPRVTISIRNSGDQDATFGAGFLAPTLLTKKSGKTFFVPSDGPSFALVTRTHLRSNPDPDIKASGSGVRGRESYSWILEDRIPDTGSLRPGEEYIATISFDLPPGEYDFLVGYGGGVHESESLVSNLVGFDVHEDGNGTIVEIKGR